jgi:hypothetical protein
MSTTTNPRTSSGEAYEVVKWYTRARRFPQLIGKTPDGATIWGGPYTYTQVIAGVAFIVIGSKTTWLWGHFGLIGNALILLGCAYGLVVLLGRLPIGSRNPISVGSGAIRALSSPTQGHLGGAKVRIRRPRPSRSRLVINHNAPSLAEIQQRRANPTPPAPSRTRSRCLPRPRWSRPAPVPAAHGRHRPFVDPTSSRTRHHTPQLGLPGADRGAAPARILGRDPGGLMRTPSRSMAANLRWTRSGSVWADWLLTGLPYGLRPTKDKHGVRALHQALFRALPGESMLLGINSGLDPAVVVSKMLDGVDLEDCPDWVAECEATLDTLDHIGPGQRIYWLSVPLGDDKPSDRFTEPFKAATSDMRDRLGLPRAAVPLGDVERRLAQAARVSESIPGPFNPTPATPAQMVWLHQHAIRRGLFQDLDLPGVGEDDVAAALLAPKTGAALGEPVLDEGGQSDLDPKSTARLNPITRRYLKVTDASSVGDVEASYQSLMVISDVPDGGMVFPGSEVIGRIDESGIDVDWAMRLSIRSSAAVASQNQRALRNLNEQYGQREGEVSHGLNMLDRVADDLAEYVSILESDKLEVEAQATMIFAVAGPTPDSSRQQARALADFLGDTGYKLSAPLGYQEELWWAMQPGVPASRAVREFAQITTSKALAATVPLASVRLGDSKGSALGLNIAHGPLLAPNVPCGPTSVVLHDLEGASDRQISGSAAVAGELGAGKTATLMKLAGDVIDRGGQLVIADRTAKGEWASWAGALTRAVVVNAADPELSLDPLRVFGPRTGSRIMQTFSPLFSTSAPPANEACCSPTSWTPPTWRSTS